MMGSQLTSVVVVPTRHLTCSLFYDLIDGFWTTSGRNTSSMWIVTDHFLLQLKSPIR